jgi:hypothetical protein
MATPLQHNTALVSRKLRCVTANDSTLHPQIVYIDGIAGRQANM